MAPQSKEIFHLWNPPAHHKDYVMHAQLILSTRCMLLLWSIKAFEEHTALYVL